MQTKTYFASSVPAAIEAARRELGADAFLVSSGPAPTEARQFGRLEVTFAWDTDAEIGQITGKLIENGFSSETATQIARGAAAKTGDPDAAVIHELTARIPIAAWKEVKPRECRTLAFIGPPGRGKTTSLVRIAMNFGLSRRVPVRICTAGIHCVGAREQMARYASILGASWQSCEFPASQEPALDGDAWEGLTLIDTPGISPADSDQMNEFGRFFAARPDVEKHLVLRADATSADMLHMVSHFSGLTPTRLLFTGLNEALSVVPMIETLVQSGMPATFAGMGQRIPEDLEELKPEQLARSAWTGSGASANQKQTRFAMAAA